MRLDRLMPRTTEDWLALACVIAIVLSQVWYVLAANHVI